MRGAVPRREDRTPGRPQRFVVSEPKRDPRLAVRLPALAYKVPQVVGLIPTRRVLVDPRVDLGTNVRSRPRISPHSTPKPIATQVRPWSLRRYASLVAGSRRLRQPLEVNVHAAANLLEPLSQLGLARVTVIEMIQSYLTDRPDQRERPQPLSLFSAHRKGRLPTPRSPKTATLPARAQS